MAAYVGAIFFWLAVPLAVYLVRRNRSISSGRTRRRRST